MTTDPTTDRPRALHFLEAADFLRDAHRDGLSVQEIGTALRHMADEADPMVGSLARDGFGLDEIAAMSAVPPADRAALSAKLWEIAEHHIVAEWICCEPLEPKHTLCAKGHAALGMARSLLVDSDPEEAWNPNAPLLDAVLAELARAQAEAHQYRTALQGVARREAATAAAPDEALRDRVAEALWPLTDWDGDRLNAERAADAALSALPPDGRAGVLLEAAERLYELRMAEREWLPATGLHKGEQELRRLAAGERDEQQAQQGGTETGTTADKAEALGMTPTEYRAHCHRAAEEQIRTAARSLYADAGIRVLAALDLSDGPVRCPLCPYPVTLHTPNGARAHFTTVHPEQRITSRGPGPWPLLATDGDEAQQQPDTETRAVDATILAELQQHLTDHTPSCNARTDHLMRRAAWALGAPRPAHVGGNAEKCPGCEGTNPPYPFICPQPEPAAAPVAGQSPADTGEEAQS